MMKIARVKMMRIIEIALKKQQDIYPTHAKLVGQDMFYVGCESDL